MSGIETVSAYLDEAGAYFLATEDGDRPKCRPMQGHFIVDGKLCFATGRWKDVYRQMRENPRVEIVALKGREFLRYYGVAVFEETYEVAEQILAKVPPMRRTYSMEGDRMLEVFHLEDAVAEIRDAKGVKETIAL